uniref:Uncharacterized protein n=1 Tax=Anguilla anguilla TaxID=7936 RepID=A0A0E9RBV0_ANGAN
MVFKDQFVASNVASCFRQDLGSGKSSK